MLDTSSSLPVSRRRLLSGVSALVAAPLAWSQTPPQPELKSVRIGVGGKTSLYHLPLALAEQLGYFKAEGMAVELKAHAGGGLAAQALAQAQLDVAAGGFEHTLFLRQKNLPCRAFVLYGRAPQIVFGVSARTLPEFQNLQQLNGRRIGISSPDSSTQWVAQVVLVRGGVPRDGVEYVNVGTGTGAVMAVREGRVDALSNSDPAISALEFSGELRVLADTRSLRGTQEVFGGPMPGGCLYAPQEFMQRYPKTVQALTNAMVRALTWLQTAGPSDLVRVVPEASMHGDRAIYLAAFDKAREAFSPDGLISEDNVRTALRTLARFGNPTNAQWPMAAPITLFYTNQFAQRAKQRFQA